MKVLKIGAIWCSGCLIMRPRWEKVEKEYPWLKTEYYDYDESPEIISKYCLEDANLPVFIFLDKDNNEIERTHGELSKDKVIELIEKYKDK